jgi:glutaminyl-tRNA synthetase
VGGDPVDTRYQFERTGYFWRDPVDGVRGRLVFNRIVPLKDTWAKRESEPALAEPQPAPALERPHGAHAGAAGDRPRPRGQDPAMAARVARYRDALGVPEEHAEVLADSPAFFERAIAAHTNAPDVASWIAVDLRGLLGGRSLTDLPFDGSAVGQLVGLVAQGRISRRAAKDVLARMVSEGGDPEALVESMGLAQVSDPGLLGAAVDAVLARWPEKVAEFRAGKESLLGLFVGEVMKQTRGAADPAAAKRLLGERLRG